MKSYHGPKPVTPTDKAMARQHLTATKQLLIKKIADHQKAKKATGNPQSKAYNQSHLASHQKDLQQVNHSLQTLQKGNPMAQKFQTKKTGTTDGKSNQLGGGGRFKQMTDHGMSSGLAAFIGRKKYGAKHMAQMAAASRKNG